jgi:hypothetical protein
MVFRDDHFAEFEFFEVFANRAVLPALVEEGVLSLEGHPIQHYP